MMQDVFTGIKNIVFYNFCKTVGEDTNRGGCRGRCLHRPLWIY